MNRTAAVAPIPVSTSRRICKSEPARVALSHLDEHDAITILTFGQFSIGDAIRALLDRAGPADVIISTWTAAKAEIERAFDLLSDDRITSMRWLVDRSFRTRQPAYCAALIKRFGMDAIRTTRTHAKFVVVRGQLDVFTVWTSANLNTNPRLETMQVIRGEEEASWLEGIVDELWRELPAGVMDAELPDHLPTEDAPPPIRMGGSVRVGR